MVPSIHWATSFNAIPNHRNQHVLKSDRTAPIEKLSKNQPSIQRPPNRDLRRLLPVQKRPRRSGYYPALAIPSFSTPARNFGIQLRMVFDLRVLYRTLRQMLVRPFNIRSLLLVPTFRWRGKSIVSSQTIKTSLPREPTQDIHPIFCPMHSQTYLATYLATPGYFPRGLVPCRSGGPIPFRHTTIQAASCLPLFRIQSQTMFPGTIRHKFTQRQSTPMPRWVSIPAWSGAIQCEVQATV